MEPKQEKVAESEPIQERKPVVEQPIQRSGPAVSYEEADGKLHFNDDNSMLLLIIEKGHRFSYNQALHSAFANTQTLKMYSP